jgi:hypothetical protein
LKFDAEFCQGQFTQIGYQESQKHCCENGTLRTVSLLLYKPLENLITSQETKEKSKMSHLPSTHHHQAVSVSSGTLPGPLFALQTCHGIYQGATAIAPSSIKLPYTRYFL